MFARLPVLAMLVFAACGDKDSDDPEDTDGHGDSGHGDSGHGDSGDGGTPEDADGDGHASVEAGGEDCDDADADVHPDAAELCNGIDDDCDGEIDEDDAVDARTVAPDADGDGYGDSSAASTACEVASGLVEDATDCDDGDSAVNPGATETCNGVDDDCNGTVDDGGAAGAWFADEDGDGYGNRRRGATTCGGAGTWVIDHSDCDDTDADAYPGAPETCGDGVDQDCDGAPDCADADCDGELSAADCACAGDDCADAEWTCGDGFDDDGDGLTDCEDGDCSGDAACVELDCADGLDSDGDGTTDCGDEDCWGMSACHERVVVSISSGEMDVWRTSRRDQWRTSTSVGSSRSASTAWSQRAQVRSVTGTLRIVPVSAATHSCGFTVASAAVTSTYNERHDTARTSTWRRATHDTSRDRDLTRGEVKTDEGCAVRVADWLPPLLGFGDDGRPCVPTSGGWSCGSDAWYGGAATAVTVTASPSDAAWGSTASHSYAVSSFGIPLASATWTREGEATGSAGAGTEADCTDGADDDLDGRVDCEDGDCVLDAACAVEVVCDDGADGDGDSRIDCGDDDCWGTEACPTAILSTPHSADPADARSTSSVYRTLVVHQAAVAGTARIYRSGTPTVQTCKWGFDSVFRQRAWGSSPHAPRFGESWTDPDCPYLASELVPEPLAAARSEVAAYPSTSWRPVYGDDWQTWAGGWGVPTRYGGQAWKAGSANLSVSAGTYAYGTDSAWRVLELTELGARVIVP